MKESHGGVEEARLESTFEHSIKTGGAQWLSFPPVVAGGSRANCLHYIANNKTIKSVARELRVVLIMLRGDKAWGYPLPSSSTYTQYLLGRERWC